MEKIIIAACARNNVIGKDGKIPWHSKEDFKHFKATTLGYPLIMGRKTFDSIGKPLPGRISIIITQNENLTYPYKEVLSYHNLEDAYQYCEEENHQKIFIIGGGQIYRKAIYNADKLIISRMKMEFDGDTFSPQINPASWRITTIEKYKEFDVYYYNKNI